MGSVPPPAPRLRVEAERFFHRRTCAYCGREQEVGRHDESDQCRSCGARDWRARVRVRDGGQIEALAPTRVVR